MRLLRFIALLWLFAAAPSWAVVTIADSSLYLNPPADGAPWQYVAQLGGPTSFGGSAVYLGNGYLLTANHVGPFGPVNLNGHLYDIDTTFGINGAKQVGTLDMKVLRITGDPNLPPLQLTNSSDPDLGQPSKLIGWGFGKGTPVPNQGWYWGDQSTAVERWGTNVTDTSLYVTQPEDGDFQGEHLTTHFDLAVGGSEAQVTGQDSGSGLFQYVNGVWKLAGLTVGADHADSVKAALYDQGNGHPDGGYYLRMETYRDQIFAIADVPEPGLGISLLLGGGILAGWPGGRRGSRKRRPPH